MIVNVSGILFWMSFFLTDDELPLIVREKAEFEEERRRDLAAVKGNYTASTDDIADVRP